MLPNKFRPLELNPDTGEPFLRLPAPHDNIIITAPRLEDASPIVPVLNDPKVCKYLLGPPHPYLQEHADSFQGLIKSEADLLINEISSKDPGAIVGGCPVRTLREVQPDGTELFLGDIAVRRHDWAELDDERERTALKEENMARDVGDPNILWAFGDYVRGSHQGRGIMSLAIGVLIKGWLIPRMNVRRMHASAFEGNTGSVRVFEKNGFVLAETIKLVREGPGFGRIEGMHIMDWKFED